MPTAHPDIFAALCKPFPPNEVRTRNQGGRSLSYITGRTAQNRLDSVLGPENWRDTYTDTPEGLRCRIEIRLAPGGEWLWKEDGGAGAGMPEVDNEEKSSYSDAFKRAAVKWGIARYLYQDGVPNYEANGHAPAPAPVAADSVRTQPAPAPSRPAPVANGNGNGFEPDGSIRKPNNGKGMFACCKEQQDKHQAEFIKPLNDWAKSQGMANRMVDWSDSDIEKGWRHLCYLVAKHTGTLGSAPSANGNGDVSGLRKAIVARAGEILSMPTGNPATDDQVAGKLRTLWSDLGFGDMGKFGSIADAGRLAELKATLDMEFKEVAEDSGIPF